jgi:hypothetical protein
MGSAQQTDILTTLGRGLTASLTLGLSLGLTLGACLDAGPRVGIGALADAGGASDALAADNGTKARPDVAATDGGPDVPPTTPCPAACDDGDPCTADTCHPQTGACIYAPAPAGTACDGGCGQCYGGGCQWPAMEPPECSDDAGCDDGDPCTLDLCVVEADACYGWAWCEHVAADGCGVPCPGGCDDGDPCTDDWCAIDGTCVNQPMWECAEAPTCGGAGVTPIHQILASGATGQLVKVAATPVPGTSWGCDDSMCGTCSNEMWLVDPDQWSGELVAAGGLPGDGSYNCETGGCTSATTCAPMKHGARYWVWGVTEPTDANGFAPPAGGDELYWPPMRLNVEGYCLQTTAAGLAGQYVGEIQHNYGYTMPVSATIKATPGGGVAVALSEIGCAGCGYTEPPQSATDVALSETGLTFGAAFPDGWQGVASRVELRSDKSQLVGEFWAEWSLPAGGGIPGSGEAPGVMMPPEGTLRLERVGD